MEVSKGNNMLLCVLLSEHNKWYTKDRALYWRTVVHLGGLAHHSLLGLYGQSVAQQGISVERFKRYESYAPLLLTLWNMMFQVAYLCMSLWLDMAEWRGQGNTKRAHTVRKYKETIFSALVVPFSLFVSLAFWLLFALDRELVFPEALDRIVPRWFNHAVHTNIVLIAALELVVERRSVPSSHARYLKVCWCAAILYSIGYYGLYAWTGLWLYPVFELLTPAQIVFFQVGIWTSMHCFYYTQWAFVRLFHGREQVKVD